MLEGKCRGKERKLPELRRDPDLDLLDVHPEVALLDHMVVLFLIF